MSDSATDQSRRSFLKASGVATGSFLFGFHLPSHGRAADATLASGPMLANTFIRISPDNTIGILVNHAEFGNGAYTALPMLAAEELDFDWSKVVIEDAPIKPEYFHSQYGEYLTGGSTSTGSSWVPMRTAAAKTRVMLLRAAAKHWSVGIDSLSTEDGYVLHDSSKRMISYGELLPVIRSHKIKAPESITLKPSSEFKVLGTDVKRLEGPEKVTGTAIFGMDFRLPGQLFASAARPPIYGGSVKSFDASEALKVKGVNKVKQISAGVVVIADTYWNARKGRDALKIEWHDGPFTGLSSEKFYAEYRETSKQSGLVAEDKGDAIKALQSASKTLESVYEVPYLAHAAMEPLSCTALVADDRCDVWVGTQYQGNDQTVVANLLGLPKDAVTINRQLIGGSFGRRSSTTGDYVADSVETARGEDVPVQLIWSREEDMHAHFFRALFVHRIKAGLDDNGMPIAWHQVAVGQSIMQNTIQEAKYMANGLDAYSVDGLVNQDYAIANHRIESHNPEKLGIVPLWWRSVAQTHTTFAYECFLDELADLGGKDPFELRLELCKDAPRMRNLLVLLGEKAGLNKPLPEGRFRGMASHQAFGTYIAEVVELSVKDNGDYTIERVCCVVDCGFAVNPMNVEAQIQGGIAYGLTAAAMGEIVLEGGKVQQSNFHDYKPLRISQMPAIDVHILNSGETTTGVGEPPTALIAPALGNALFAATGKRLRTLPFSKHGFNLV